MGQDDAIGFFAGLNFHGGLNSEGFAGHIG